MPKIVLKIIMLKIIIVVETSFDLIILSLMP